MLMVAELKGIDPHPSMLQVGLIRWDQSKFQMQPGVTDRLWSVEELIQAVCSGSVVWLGLSLSPSA